MLTCLLCSSRPATHALQQPLTSATRSQLAVVALVNTGSLWQYTGEDDPAPLLVARVVGRGVDSAIDPSTLLQQPAAGDAQAPVGKQDGMCAPLDPGAAHLPGFWSGGVSAWRAALPGRNAQRAPTAPPASRLAAAHAHTLTLPSLCAAPVCVSVCAGCPVWQQHLCG